MFFHGFLERDNTEITATKTRHHSLTSGCPEPSTYSAPVNTTGCSANNSDEDLLEIVEQDEPIEVITPSPGTSLAPCTSPVSSELAKQRALDPVKQSGNKVAISSNRELVSSAARGSSQSSTSRQSALLTCSVSPVSPAWSVSPVSPANPTVTVQSAIVSVGSIVTPSITSPQSAKLPLATPTRMKAQKTPPRALASSSIRSLSPATRVPPGQCHQFTNISTSSTKPIMSAKSQQATTPNTTLKSLNLVPIRNSKSVKQPNLPYASPSSTASTASHSSAAYARKSSTPYASQSSTPYARQSSTPYASQSSAAYASQSTTSNGGQPSTSNSHQQRTPSGRPFPKYTRKSTAVSATAYIETNSPRSEIRPSVKKRTIQELLSDSDDDLMLPTMKRPSVSMPSVSKASSYSNTPASQRSNLTIRDLLSSDEDDDVDHASHSQVRSKVQSATTAADNVTSVVNAAGTSRPSIGSTFDVIVSSDEDLPEINLDSDEERIRSSHMYTNHNNQSSAYQRYVAWCTSIIDA